MTGSNSTARPAARKRPAAGRGATIAIAVVALAAAALFAWRQAGAVHRVDVRIDPPRLVAGDTGAAVLTLLPLNRLGGRAPFRTLRFRCAVTEGATLVALQSNADSTVVRIRSLGIPGRVELRVTTDAWPWPLLAVFDIDPALACIEAPRGMTSTPQPQALLRPWTP